MRVAVVRDGSVLNVVEAESLETLAAPAFAQVFPGAEFRDVTGDRVGPGWSWDADADGWVEPPVEEPAPEP